MRLEVQGEREKTVGSVEALYDQRRGEFDGGWARSRMSRIAGGFESEKVHFELCLSVHRRRGGLAGRVARSRRYLQRPKDGFGKYCSSFLTTPLQLERVRGKEWTRGEEKESVSNTPSYGWRTRTARLLR